MILKKKKQDFNFFKDFEVTDELEKKVLDSTIYKKRNKKIILKPVFYILIIGFVLSLSVGVMAKDYVKSFIVNIIKTDDITEVQLTLNGKVKINDKITDKLDCTKANINDIENYLGINLLDHIVIGDMEYESIILNETYKEMLRKENGYV